MSSKIGFINHVSTQPEATLECYKSIRRFYPDAPFFLSIDGLCKDNYQDWFLDQLSNEIHLGYPPYSKDNVLEWLQRMFIGMVKLGTDHVCMVEDDMLVINTIQYPENVECFGHNITIGNYIHKSLLHEIESFSKQPINPLTQYGGGGGSIFKCSTFIDNYDKVTRYIDKNWSLFEEHYWPQCGYMDCYMVLYYLLCGREYTRNLRMINLWPADYTSTPEQLIATYGDEIDIIHNWKKHYVR